MTSVGAAVLVFVAAASTASAQSRPEPDWRSSLAARARSCLAPAGAVSGPELLRQLRVLVRLTGDKRWTRAQPAWLLERNVEALARLSAERAAAAAALRAAVPERAGRYAQDAADDRARAAALADVLGKLGHPEYARALPFAQPERVVLVRETDAPVAALEAGREPYARFDGRVLIVVSLDELARHAAPILYLSRDAFVADLRDLGKREREREFRRRLQQGATPDAYATHLASLDIDQAALAVALLDRVAAGDPQRPAIAGVVDGQLAQVRAGLAVSAAIPAGEAAARLQACRRGFSEEAARWSTEAQRRGDSATADAIAAVARSTP